MIFQAESVTAGYLRAQPVLHDISIVIPRGNLYALIGPNGSGKSTLLRVLLGALPTNSGHVVFDNRDVGEWDRKQMARRVGVVTQFEELPFTTTVRETVAMGRYPHLGALQSERATDRDAIESAMRRCDVAELRDRAMQSLSGGERQRARIARALAQTPDVLVLDEPTAALDIGHEMRVFELMRFLAHDEGKTVIVATHQINHAARYADTLVLMDRGRINCAGPPAVVVTRENLEQVYQWPIAIHAHVGAGFDHGAPQITPLSQKQNSIL